MKLGDFYRQVVRLGARHDPRRNKSAIKSYADTAILYGSPETEVKNIMVGIDIEVADLLLADRLRQARGLDLVISHHPEGRAYAGLDEVMRLQVDVLKGLGIGEKVAAALLDERRQEVKRRILPQNHTRAQVAAKLLDLPFMCMHTPADNHAFCFIRDLLAEKKPRRVSDIVDILLALPEYKEAVKGLCGPQIILGSPNREAGRILVEMTGGTEGPRDVYDKLYKAGVRTLVSMHLSEEHLKKAKEANLNAVIAGHISSDTLGINLLLDNIEREFKQRLSVIDCSGFVRVRRNGRTYSR